jgi:hypothetical protein
MALKFNGTTEYLVRTGAVLTVMPLTMAAWVRLTTTAVSQDLVAITDIGSTNDGFRMLLSSTVPAFQAGGRQLGGQGNATGTVNPGTSGFNHACAVFTSATNFAIFTNGGDKVTQVAGNTPTAANLNRTCIGAYVSTSIVNPSSGSIAEVGIWNVALTDPEVLALARGTPPARVRPANLVGYWPLYRQLGLARDFTQNRNDMTAVGAPMIDPHPPVSRVCKPMRVGGRWLLVA